MRQTKRAARKLGLTEPDDVYVMERPKGVHKRTFRRLRQDVIDAMKPLLGPEIRTIKGVFTNQYNGKEREVTLEGVIIRNSSTSSPNWAFTTNSGTCPGQ